MVLPAIADVRELAPDAEIDLVVGSWNEALAGAVPAVTRVEALDARWLARETSGQGLAALLRRARSWRRRRYDVAINFEPDIRSNLLTAASGAAFTAGYRSGGGGGVLDRALDYDPRAHTSDNARALVAAVFGRQAPGRSQPPLAIPAALRRKAALRLGGSPEGPLVGMHVERRARHQAVATRSVRRGRPPPLGGVRRNHRATRGRPKRRRSWRPCGRRCATAA